MLSTATRCMFTPMATEASPRARRLEATTRSCAERDAEPAEPDRDGRGEVARGLERVDRLERVSCRRGRAAAARAASSSASALGERHEVGRRRSVMGGELDRHRAPQRVRDGHRDGHAVGDHVVDGRALPGALHDLAELLLGRVAGHAERDADALEPVARLVRARTRRAHRCRPSRVDSTEVSATLRAAAT